MLRYKSKPTDEDFVCRLTRDFSIRPNSYSHSNRGDVYLRFLLRLLTGSTSRGGSGT
jgi:hypothetical protein